MVPKGPWRITFDTNPDDCNLSCIMCERFSIYAPKMSDKPRRMNFNIVEQVVSETVPRGLREIIPSTMGEPLLYDKFESLVDLCSQKRISLNVTTNGTWPRFSPKRWAEILCPVTSDVKISWNGATAETQEAIMPGSRFECRLEDLRAFISVRDEVASSDLNRCSVTLQCTFMERNTSELPGLIRLALDLGVDRVKGHHLWVHSEEMASEDMRRSTRSRLRWNKVVEECQRVAHKNQKTDGRMVKLVNFTPLPEFDSISLPKSWECPFLGKEAWINAEGRFDPCCAPDAERQDLGFFGYVTEPGGFTTIWNNEKYSRLARNYISNPVCQKCNMRKPPEEMY